MTGVSFEAEIRAHMAETYRFCIALAGNESDAEDLMQEAFTRALGAWPGFRGESSFRTWLFSIALFAHRDGLRRASTWRRRVAERPLVDGQLDPGIAQAEAADARSVLLRRLSALPPRQREVMALHLQDGLSYEEIAGVLGITYSDVKVTLSLARRRLRETCRGVLP